jgi:hypothetical protein
VLEVRGAGVGRGVGVGKEGTVDVDAGENVEAAREVEAVLRIGRVGRAMMATATSGRVKGSLQQPPIWCR